MNFEQIWSIVSPYTLLNRHKVRNIHRLLSQILANPSVHGDIGECGVFQGGISLLMALTVAQSQVPRKVFLFDSFEGLPAPNPSADLPFYKAGSLKASLGQVQGLLNKHELARHTEIYKGWFEDTLAQLPSEQRFCFLHIDCDLYDSTKTCLHHLYEKIVDNGVMVFDDYFDIGGGERRAVDEFLVEHGRELLFAGPAEQVFFFKGQQIPTSDRPNSLTFPDGTTVSLSYLIDDVDYLADLQNDALMTELPGGSLGKAAELACQTLKIYEYHQKILRRLKIKA